MGMYTGLRFKGIVKEQFRDEFKDIALKGEWEKAKDIKLNNFSNIDRAFLIPNGSLAYMPGDWEEIDRSATDGFVRKYDKNTGYWSFQCSLKNYEGTIEEFFKLVPYFIDSVEHAEVYYEEWAYSKKYELRDGVMIRTDNCFIQYGYVN